MMIGSHKHGVVCKSSISLSVISVVHMFTATARKVHRCSCSQTRPHYELLRNIVPVNPATTPIHCNNESECVLA